MPTRMCFAPRLTGHAGSMRKCLIAGYQHHSRQPDSTAALRMLRRLTGPASRLPGYMASVMQNSAVTYTKMQRLSTGVADLDRSADRTTSRRPHASLWLACMPSCAGFQGQSGAALAAVNAALFHPELRPEHKLRTCPSASQVHHVQGSM